MEVLKEGMGKLKFMFDSFNPMYELDQESGTYFIHVYPESLNDDETFQLKCGEIILESIDADIKLCFITSQSLTKLKNPKYLFNQ